MTSITFITNFTSVFIDPPLSFIFTATRVTGIYEPSKEPSRFIIRLIFNLFLLFFFILIEFIYLKFFLVLVKAILIDLIISTFENMFDTIDVFIREVNQLDRSIFFAMSCVEEINFYLVMIFKIFFVKKCELFGNVVSKLLSCERV